VLAPTRGFSFFAQLSRKQKSQSRIYKLDENVLHTTECHWGHLPSTGKKGHKPIEFVNNAEFSISMATCKPKYPRPYRITIVSDALITLPKLNYHSPAAGAK